MKLIEFAEQTIVIAKDQPEYTPMPAYGYDNDAQGKIVCCWKLTPWERVKLLLTGKLWHTILTFHQAIQPQLLSAAKPDMPPHETKIVDGPKTVCRRCGADVPQLKKWSLVSTDAGGRHHVTATPFCSESCAEAFGDNCIGELRACQV